MTPQFAEEVAELVQPTWVGLDHDSWGIDHGTWSVLVHAFPSADIPVVQLAINAEKPFEYHLALGAQLAPLRERGVLIVGSGNVVHNLGRIDWTRPDGRVRLGAALRGSGAGAHGEPAGGSRRTCKQHPDFRAAVPTPDHFIPLLYLAGLAGCARDGRPMSWSTATHTAPSR